MDRLRKEVSMIKKWLVKQLLRYDDLKKKKREQLLEQKRNEIFNLSKGKNIIVLSNDCVGGMIMKDYGLPCFSPTVNVHYSGEDFLKICENPSYYFAQEVRDYGMDDEGHPMGKCDDIILHYGHSKSFAEGNKKWRVGCKAYFRAINKKHEVCIIDNDRNGFTETEFERYMKLPYVHKILFVHRPEWKNDYTCLIQEEEKFEAVKGMTSFENFFSVKRRYDRFDFYRWFKEIAELDEEAGEKYI